jgi:hypothetical protein
MGPPSNIRSGADRNVVMRLIPVYLSGDASHLSLFQKFRCNNYNKAIKCNVTTLCTVSTQLPDLASAELRCDVACTLGKSYSLLQARYFRHFTVWRRENIVLNRSILVKCQSTGSHCGVFVVAVVLLHISTQNNMIYYTCFFNFM